MLKNPEFGNTLELIPRIIVHQSVNGHVAMTRTATWPVHKRISLEFKNMTLLQKTELKDFIISAQGIRVEYTTPDGLEYSGYILDREITFVEEGKDKWSSSFQLEQLG